MSKRRKKRVPSRRNIHKVRQFVRGALPQLSARKFTEYLKSRGCMFYNAGAWASVGYKGHRYSIKRLGLAREYNERVLQWYRSPPSFPESLALDEKRLNHLARTRLGFEANDSYQDELYELAATWGIAKLEHLVNYYRATFASTCPEERFGLLLQCADHLAFEPGRYMDSTRLQQWACHDVLCPRADSILTWLDVLNLGLQADSPEHFGWWLRQHGLEVIVRSSCVLVQFLRDQDREAHALSPEFTAAFEHRMEQWGCSPIHFFETANWLTYWALIDHLDQGKTSFILPRYLFLLGPQLLERVLRAQRKQGLPSIRRLTLRLRQEFRAAEARRAAGNLVCPPTPLDSELGGAV